MNTTAKPPQPSGSLPIIGHLHLLGGLPHIALGRLADKFGPIYMIKLGVHRALVVSTAETAKECLGANDKVFLNRPYTMFAEFLGYNSAMFGLAPYGQYWREIRKITTVELLSNHQIEMFKDIRFSEIRSAIKRTSSSGEMSELVDMKQWFKDISLNTVVRTVLGKSLKENYQDEEYTRCLKAIREFFVLGGAFVPADALPFLRWLDIGGYEKKMKKAALDIDVIAQNWLEEHRRRRRSKETQEKRYFMDAMLDIMENTQENVSKFEADTIIKATCMFTLAKLLHAFEITILSDEAVDMTEGFGLTNLKATPLEVILTHRLPHNIYI
ncbi:hypothetical protein BVRB_8g199900 [Beta vulgaris subsp. vulgaris]|uniref:Cytochrome P450 n=1 Tax=Beta vulgaris subsp. vulgaris TaxID=3555 RepID=A0A0J8B9Z3_BETVV|nr:hypothetical protein BVRB_8g199900 [Beta vulgaris subsp. vulgaris]